MGLISWQSLFIFFILLSGLLMYNYKSLSGDVISANSSFWYLCCVLITMLILIVIYLINGQSFLPF